MGGNGYKIRKIKQDDLSSCLDLSDLKPNNFNETDYFRSRIFLHKFLSLILVLVVVFGPVHKVFADEIVENQEQQLGSEPVPVLESVEVATESDLVEEDIENILESEEIEDISGEGPGDNKEDEIGNAEILELEPEPSSQSVNIETETIEGDEETVSEVESVGDIDPSEEEVVEEELSDDKELDESGSEEVKEESLDEKDDIVPAGGENKLNTEANDEDLEDENVNDNLGEGTEPEEIPSSYIDPGMAREEILSEIFRELNVSSLEELRNKVEIADKNIYSNAADNYKVQTSSVSSDLYSAKDSDADREIYISSGGEIVKITDNDREDDFPSWDLNKENIVWQSLIDGRWQVFFYNLSDKKETQITNTTFNNTSPAVQGSVLVWQGWVDDNWEVFMAEYKNSTALGESWSIKQLTDNYYHDMFPKISGNLIIWQAFYKENWHIFAYDLVKEQVYQISSGGGANENPRFAVVWDSRNPNGEFKSIAYDIVTGQPISLSFPDNKEDDKSSDMPLLPKTENNEVPAVSIQSGPASKSDEGDIDPQE